MFKQLTLCGLHVQLMVNHTYSSPDSLQKLEINSLPRYQRMNELQQYPGCSRQCARPRTPQQRRFFLYERTYFSETYKDSGFARIPNAVLLRLGQHLAR